MTNLPESELIQLLPLEIYDEASFQDDTLIWLAPEESAPSHQPPATFETLSLDVSRNGDQPTAVPSPGERLDVLLPEPVQSSGNVVALLPLECAASESAAGAEVNSKPAVTPEAEATSEARVTASPLTYNAVAQFNITRWLLRVAALVSVLLIGSVLPSILQHMRPSPATASAAAIAPSIGTSHAAVRVLTVMAGRQDTVRDLSARLVGRYDASLLEEIRSLNPDLKDPDHLEDGQLIRIPLRITAPAN